MSNTKHTTMKTKNTYSVSVVHKNESLSVVHKDESLSTITVKAWGISWISHEVEKALNVNLPLDAEIIKIEKIK
jgi:hypothetical protein